MTHKVVALCVKPTEVLHPGGTTLLGKLVNVIGVRRRWSNPAGTLVSAPTIYYFVLVIYLFCIYNVFGEQ
jgi:hypothetical protein